MRSIIPQRKRFPAEIEQHITRLHLDGRTVSDITETLRRKFGEDAPSAKTVLRRIHAIAAADESETWSVTNGNAEDLPLVLPVLAELIRQSGGRTHSMTQPRAQLVARIRHAAPDIPAWQALELSSAYIESSRAGADSKAAVSADIFLAYAPWRSDEASDLYARAFEDGGLRGLTRFAAVEDPDEFRYLLAISPTMTSALVIEDRAKQPQTRGRAIDQNRRGAGNAKTRKR